MQAVGKKTAAGMRKKKVSQLREEQRKQMSKAIAATKGEMKAANGIKTSAKLEVGMKRKTIMRHR